MVKLLGTVVVTAALLVCACRGRDTAIEEKVRSKAAVDLPCSEDKIQVTPGSVSKDEPDMRLFNAEGCGSTIVYMEKDGQVKRHDGSFYMPR